MPVTLPVPSTFLQTFSHSFPFLYLGPLKGAVLSCSLHQQFSTLACIGTEEGEGLWKPGCWAPRRESNSAGVGTTLWEPLFYMEPAGL